MWNPNESPYRVVSYPKRGGYYRPRDLVNSFPTEQEAREFASQPVPMGYQKPVIDKATWKTDWHTDGHWVRVK